MKVEKDFQIRKKAFESGVTKLRIDLEEVKDFKKFREYINIMPTINNFHEKVRALDERKEELSTEQSLLFGFKDNTDSLQGVV